MRGSCETKKITWYCWTHSCYKIDGSLILCAVAEQNGLNASREGMDVDLGELNTI